MLARTALFILMAIGLAGFGAVAWISLNPTPREHTNIDPANNKLPLLIAARPLRAGTLVKPDDIAAEPRSPQEIPAGGHVDSEAVRGELLGAMIRRNLAKGEPLLTGDVLNPGDRGFLAAVLGAGMRAVTVGVDAVSGLSGLVWPGDRVDLILTQSQEGVGIPASHRVSGETVLHDVRVLAIDRQLIQGATSESPQAQTVRTVTLEVTPPDAERVVVAERLGHLSLAVVAVAPTTSRADATSVTQQTGNSVTWGGDVSSALRGGPSSDGTSVRLFQGPSDSKEIKF
ncbi:MAG TPA: Flp pilus assembly protein CpaB [Acetobacteraceae bacterium]|jgi:pilus assembly protein CpaB|nr:Flp pilus assembly protein CpaB [Acetobacteraceae bacterium]